MRQRAIGETENWRGENEKSEDITGFAAVILVIIMVAPEIAANGYVNSGTSFTFTTSDGGNGSNDGYPFQQGFNYPSSDRVEAYAGSPSAGYHEGFANVWHLVDCGYTGEYQVQMHGHYWGSGSAAGVVADALVRFYIRIEDVQTGFVYNSATIRRLEAIGFWAFNEQSDFSTTALFDGTAGHTYRIGLSADCIADAVAGTSIANAHGGGQGAYFTSCTVSYYNSGWYGGCVLGQSNVAMADGKTIHASRLRIGDQVLGYDPSTDQIITESVMSNVQTRVGLVIAFNGGTLITTPNDQPIYVRSGNYTGWIRDPMNITIGSQVYLPLDHKWMQINTATYMTGSFQVNDIKTDGLNNYMANGVLVDVKTQ